MATQIQVDDEIRIKILEALGEKNSVAPNVRQIQKHTGFHKATIKASLDFLQKENLLEGFGPKINFRRLGYKLEISELLQVDMSQKKVFEKFIKAAQNDPHLHFLASVIGSGNVNMIARHFYEDIESFHRETQRRYYEGISGFAGFVKSRNVFYITEPTYKRSSRTNAVIDIIKKKRGIE